MMCVLPMLILYYDESFWSLYKIEYLHFNNLHILIILSMFNVIKVLSVLSPFLALYYGTSFRGYGIDMCSHKHSETDHSMVHVIHRLSLVTVCHYGWIRILILLNSNSWFPSSFINIPNSLIAKSKHCQYRIWTPFYINNKSLTIHNWTETLGRSKLCFTILNNYIFH